MLSLFYSPEAIFHPPAYNAATIDCPKFHSNSNDARVFGKVMGCADFLALSSDTEWWQSGRGVEIKCEFLHFQTQTLRCDFTMSTRHKWKIYKMNENVFNENRNLLIKWIQEQSKYLWEWNNLN